MTAAEAAEGERQVSPDYAITPMAIPTLMAVYPAGMGFAALFALFALVGTKPRRRGSSECVSLASGGTSVASADRVSAVAPRGLTQGDSTPGIVREVAFATDRALHVRGRVNGGVVSGWHHHGDREVLGYVVRGRLRFEFGPGGAKSTEVEEGGFFHVPVGLVHRDVNPLDEPQEFVIAFVGEGPLVVNLDGPEPA
jgi:uncharacterized RmlC-like cupin family protein